MTACHCQNEDCMLCEAHLYSGLSSDQVCEVRGMISKNYYDEGEVLFRQGQDSEYLHIVRDGLVKLSISDADGNEQIIGLCVMGHVVGFDSLGDHKHAYTAKTLTPAVTCSVKQTDMLHLYDQNPSVARQTIQLLNQELTYAQNLIHTLGQKSSAEKVALLILSLVPPGSKDQRVIELPLPLSRKEIAQFLGLTIETVSRLISDLKRRKIVEPKRGVMRILDIEPLKEIAGIGSASITDSLKMMVDERKAAS